MLNDADAGDLLILPSLGSRLVDYGIVYALSGGLQFLTASLFNVPSVEWFTQTSALLSGWVVLTMSVPLWTYTTLSVASPRAATLGHRLAGVQVISDKGGSVSTGQSLLRTAVQFAGWELAHSALFVPHNFATGEPAPWQYVGLSVASLYLIADVVTVIVTNGRKSVADLVAGTSLVRHPR